MALGNTDIKTIQNCNENIRSAISFGNESGNCLYSAWNTFQYVAKNLNTWADETVIGANIKQDLTNLSNALYSLMQTTNKLNTKIEEFTTNQSKLNQSSTTTPQYEREVSTGMEFKDY